MNKITSIFFRIAIMAVGIMNLHAERYSFALIPTKNDAQEYVKFAHTFFKSYAHKYLLGEKSIPHITLCQFEAEPRDVYYWKHRGGHPIFSQYTPSFAGISFIEGAGTFEEGIQWIELVVQLDKELMDLQKECLDLLESREISPLNAVGIESRPHLTLANTTFTGIFGFTFPKHLLNPAPFTVHLIKNDENWQCVGIESKTETSS